MKIGIVTFYAVSNYGAMLQAYALWQYLKRRGHDVSFINMDRWEQERYPAWKIPLSRSIHDFRTKLRIYLRYPMTEFASCFTRTRRYASVSELMRDAPDYDAFVVGSDQVWNPLWCAPGLIPMVFLEFVGQGRKRIAYAASFGAKKWSHVESKQKVGMLLREFDAISVREESGVDLVRELSGREAKCLLDPTLLWERCFYDGLYDKAASAKNPYVFSYVLRQWAVDERESNYLVALSRAMGNCDIVTEECLAHGGLAFVAKALGVNAAVAVSEWLLRLSGASAVLTNSFHGTVFSILFHRPFVTVLVHGVMSGMNERVYTLLKLVGLEERAVDNLECEDVVNLMNRPIDWDVVDERLRRAREKTETFFSETGL